MSLGSRPRGLAPPWCPLLPLVPFMFTSFRPVHVYIDGGTRGYYRVLPSGRILPHIHRVFNIIWTSTETVRTHGEAPGIGKVLARPDGLFQ